MSNKINSQNDDKKQLRNLLRNKLNDRMLEQHASHSISSSSSSATTTTDATIGYRVLISKEDKSAPASLQLDMHALLGTNTQGRNLESNTPPFYIIKEDINTHFMFAEVGSTLHELKTNPTIVPCSTQHPNQGHPNIICSSNLYHLRLDATKISTPKDQPNEFKYLDYTGNEVLIQQYSSLTSSNNSAMASDMASSTTTSTSSTSMPFEMSGLSLTFLIAFGFVGALIIFIGCGWLMFYCCEKTKTRGKGLLDDNDASSVGDGVKITSTRKKQKNRFGTGSLTHDESMTTRTMKTKNTRSKSMNNQHDQQQRDCLGGTGKEDSIQQAFNVHDVMSGGGVDHFNDDSERSHVSIYFEDEENQDQSELYDDSEVSYKEVKQSSWISSFWNKPQTVKTHSTSRGGGGNSGRPKRSKSASSIGVSGASVTSVSSSATDPNTSK